jgi:phenylpropionate dioxygenase-like ring-hydroxylating dioxygenase large terminal subunit
LFGDIRRNWVPAEFARRLRSQPRAVDVGGIDLVLFRDARGVAHALVDRCPHRSVRLSLGRVTEGCLECPYHGWRFAGDGRCTQVPFNPEAKHEQLGATAVPTVERGGLIWVFTDELARADDPLVSAGPKIPEMLERADMRRREAEFVWRCHWTRLAENMLDVAHLPFVHRKTIGRGLSTTTALQQIDATDYGFELRWHIDDAPITGDPFAPEARAGQAWLQWWRPSASVLDLPNPLGEYRQHLFSVPGKPGETRLLLVSTRRYKLGLDLLFKPLIDWFEDRIVGEDQAVIESSEPAVVPEPGLERSVASDAATLRFRKWYHQHQRELEAEPTRLPIVR